MITTAIGGSGGSDWSASSGAGLAVQNPADTAIASQLQSQIGSTSVAISNVGNSMSLLDTAGSALGQVTDVLQQMRDLTVQAGDGSYGPQDRAILQTQIAALGQTLDQITGGTSFNGQSLLSGGYSSSVQNGPNASDQQGISLSDATSAGLGVGNLQLGTAQDRASSLQAIDQAIGQLGSQQAQIGASENGFDFQTAALGVQQEAETASLVRTQDGGGLDGSASPALKQQIATQLQNSYQSLQQGGMATLLNLKA